MNKEHNKTQMHILYRSIKNTSGVKCDYELDGINFGSKCPNRAEFKVNFYRNKKIYRTDRICEQCLVRLAKEVGLPPFKPAKLRFS